MQIFRKTISPIYHPPIFSQFSLFTEASNLLDGIEEHIVVTILTWYNSQIADQSINKLHAVIKYSLATTLNRRL